MKELIIESFKVVNLPVTLLLLIVLVYWFMVLVGFTDNDLFENAEGSSSTKNGSRIFLVELMDFGRIPVTIVFSLLTVIFWSSTLCLNHFIENNSLLLAIVLYIPLLLSSFLFTRFILIRLNKIFEFLTSGPESEFFGDFSGSVCFICSDASEERVGQGEINRNGDPIRIKLKTYPGKLIKKGQQAILIKYFPDKGYYIAEPCN